MSGWKTGLLLGTLPLALLAFTLPQTAPKALQELQRNTAYQVAVENDAALLDLNFTDENEYLLILNSLGNPLDTFEIQLLATACNRLSYRPFAPLQPLPDIAPHLAVSQVAEEKSPPKFVATQAETKTNAKTKRTFHLHVTEGDLQNARHYAKVPGRVIAAGNRVRVYLDEQMQSEHLHPKLAASIVEILEQDVLPKTDTHLGKIRDIDGDRFFSVLLTPWLGKLQGGKTSLGGFVRGSDFRPGVESPFSNQMDMLYLNTNLVPGEHLRTLLAHEVTHAVSFSERFPSEENRYGCPTEEDWLNEAIAHLGENLVSESWTNLDYRISRFLNSPQAYPLVISDYYQSGMWRNHGCRGATYLFLRWCVDQFGPQLPGRLIHGTARGTTNLEQATGISFPELFRHWTLALSTQKTNATGKFRYLDLQGSLNQWNLIGPREILWDVNKNRPAITLRGTSTAFVRLRSSSPKLQRIQLKATYGTRLQATLIRLPRPTSELHVRTIQKSSSSPLISLELTNSGETDISLTQLSMETHLNDHRRTLRFTPHTFAKLGLKTNIIPAHQTVRCILPAELLAVEPNLAEQKWIIKIQAAKIHANSGEQNRITAWHDLNVMPKRLRISAQLTDETSEQTTPILK